MSVNEDGIVDEVMTEAAERFRQEVARDKVMKALIEEYPNLFNDGDKLVAVRFEPSAIKLQINRVVPLAVDNIVLNLVVDDQAKAQGVGHE